MKLLWLSSSNLGGHIGFGLKSCESEKSAKNLVKSFTQYFRIIKTNMATEGSSSNSHVGKVLELKSPFGTESMTYKWPLKKGRGSIRRSEVRSILILILNSL